MKNLVIFLVLSYSCFACKPVILGGGYKYILKGHLGQFSYLELQNDSTFKYNRAYRGKATGKWHREGKGKIILIGDKANFALSVVEKNSIVVPNNYTIKLSKSDSTNVLPNDFCKKIIEINKDNKIFLQEYETHFTFEKPIDSFRVIVNCTVDETKLYRALGNSILYSFTYHVNNKNSNYFEIKMGSYNHLFDYVPIEKDTLKVGRGFIKYGNQKYIKVK